MNEINQILGPCLVTGGSGYLGSALVKRLSEIGCKVTSLDLFEPYYRIKNVKYITGDIRDYKTLLSAIKGNHSVFHTAVKMSLLGKCRDSLRDEVFSINLEGTKNAVRASIESGAKRLIYTSTNTVCFSWKDLVNGDESQPYAENCIYVYAESKIAAEREVLAADNSRIRTVSIRPAGIWGPGNCYMFASLIEQLSAGKFVATIGNGRSLSDNTHIDNLVNAHILAAKKLSLSPGKVGGQAYFITDEEQMNLIEWFRPMIEGLGYKVPSAKIPAKFAYLLAWIMEWIHYLGGPKPLLSRLEVHNLTTSFTFKTDKARKELGYEPLIGRDLGMTQSLNSCLAMLRSKRSFY
jgi:3beta-hydroxy-delta5-steroid dehydrogenase/steroid delta-isomerase